MAQWIPTLPSVLSPGYAYGTLQVRDQATQRLRTEVVAKLNLETGAFFAEVGISRDAYDWGLDTIHFRPFRTREAFLACEDTALEAEPFPGEPEVEFCLDPEDLERVAQAWERHRPTLEASLPRRGLKPR